MEPEKFSWKKRGQSFGYAFSGLAVFFRTQHNAWLHGAATVGVLGAGAWFHIQAADWALVMLAIGMVWSAELFNTALEKLCDRISPGKDPDIKFIKDVAAAAVLVTAIASVVMALFIFIPYFK